MCGSGKLITRKRFYPFGRSVMIALDCVQWTVMVNNSPGKTADLF
jgi:hypothetical protein